MRKIERGNSILQLRGETILSSMLAYNVRGKKYEEYQGILRSIYSNICPYCQSTIEHSGYFEIEHFYPKRVYKQLAKEFRNLHFSCKRCNLIKGVKDTFKEKIISPNFYLTTNSKPIRDKYEWEESKDDFIEDELHYIGLFAVGLHSIGKDTIDAFDLNNANGKRNYLIEERIRTFHHAFILASSTQKILEKVNFQQECVDFEIVKIQLMALTEMTSEDHQYSSMVVHNFGEIILSLIECYLRVKRKFHTTSLVKNEIKS